MQIWSRARYFRLFHKSQLSARANVCVEILFGNKSEWTLESSRQKPSNVIERLVSFIRRKSRSQAYIRPSVKGVHQAVQEIYRLNVLGH